MSFTALRNMLAAIILCFSIVGVNPVQAQPFCDEPQPGSGFPSDILCQTAVCAIDLFCCATTWDAICADLAANNPACVGCLSGGGGGGGNQLCPSCENPCGDALGYATPPTVQQVVDDCDNDDFIPPLASNSLNTFCNSFTATATSVDFNVIITSDCGAGNVTNFSWQLYDITCGAPIQTGSLASLTFSPVTPGNSYVFCYTFNVPFGCTHSLHCPYFVGATVDPCPTASISYPNTVLCASEAPPQDVVLEGTENFTGGTFSAQPGGLAINPTTGQVTPDQSNSGTYTVTYTIAASGNCDAVTAETTITIEEEVMPEFNDAGPFCLGSDVPALPTTSSNGITGSWTPAINNLQTTTYTFTPNAGQCAGTTTLEIVIDTEIEPMFDEVDPFCTGSDIPALPTISNNGITGNWAPAINNTATTTYTFTSDPGQCAVNTTLVIEIETETTPDFTELPAYCVGSDIPPLPTMSNDGITGSWAPAINNTATTTYTFTPDPGQCAESTTLEVVITPETTPLFDEPDSWCEGATIPALPTTSNNGITGTWSPAINNEATTNYTFTPGVGQCASQTSLTIVITPPVEATFSDVGPFCQGTAIPALPTISLNGFTGSWAPDLNNNETTTYTFTPSAGECASSSTLTIEIEETVTPAFEVPGPFCADDDIPALPTTSLNGIDGSWSPAINNLQTTTYTFTPSGEGCSETTTLTMEVLQATETVVEVVECDSYTWPQNGDSYTQSGVHSVVLSNAAGCDSTIVLDLTINFSEDITSDVSACGSYTWFGTNYTQSGVYEYEGLNVWGCEVNAVLTLSITPNVVTDVFAEICDGDMYTIGSNSYMSSGTYIQVFPASNGCDSIVNHHLEVLPPIIADFRASPQEATIYDEQVQFFNESINADSLEWDFGEWGTFTNNNPVLTFDQQPGIYPVCLTVWSIEGCSDQRCINYLLRDDFSVYIPNAFTPNEDGINDLFAIEGVGIDPGNFMLRIFNRWGQLVFESTDPEMKWNGSDRTGKYYAQDEVYVYHLKVGSTATLETYEFRGSITVIR